MTPFSEIIHKDTFTRDDIIRMLTCTGDEINELFARSAKVKEENVGNVVYFRGLIEFSNICSKNCYYCGIRKGNRHVKRYNISDDEIIEAARFAYENDFGSVVLQGGELESEAYTARIENLLHRIKEISDDKLGVTLSVGEQSPEVYKRWFAAGAHRYLLRIESSDQQLYYKIHPTEKKHRFERRIKALHDLREAGYQVGTGVMIGLPFQTAENLADDLLFMKNLDIDMCGMGPYIEHHETPLYQYKDLLLPLEERFVLSLKMIAILRLLMKNINIAASTALQAIDPFGREKALQLGANIIMPNITPGIYRDDYNLYENKPKITQNAEDYKRFLEERIAQIGNVVGYNKWGDSLHFKERSGGEAG